MLLLITSSLCKYAFKSRIIESKKVIAVLFHEEIKVSQKEHVAISMYIDRTFRDV